jgi:ATP-dependent RNA circularization protein (DNA/RNA ligase family)
MFKFPKTPHLAVLDVIPVRDDKIMTEQEREEFLTSYISVEEKVDGANLGISFNDDGEIVFQNRGNFLIKPYRGQWEKLQGWLITYQEELFEILANNYILFGEWCYAKHSIYYDNLPDLFLAFDLYDVKEGKFLSRNNRNDILERTRVSIVREIAQGYFSFEEVKQLITKSIYNDELVEGIYLRTDEGDCLKTRAKLIRPQFIQQIGEHWSNKQIVINKTHNHSFL